MEFMSGSGVTRVDMGCKGSPVADKGQYLALYVIVYSLVYCEAQHT